MPDTARTRSRKKKFHLLPFTLAIAIGGTWILFQLAAKENAPGSECTQNSDCASNYCYPGPDNKRYCISAEKNCARPGAVGVMYGERYDYGSVTYECRTGGTLARLRASSNGMSCESNVECQSNYCYPGPDAESRVCIDANMNCAFPGVNGFKYGQCAKFKGTLYRCTQGEGWVKAEGCQ